MPNPVKERSPEQTAISVSITKDLLTRIDDRASEVGLSRSRYIAVIAQIDIAKGGPLTIPTQGAVQPAPPVDLTAEVTEFLKFVVPILNQYQDSHGECPPPEVPPHIAESELWPFFLKQRHQILKDKWNSSKDAGYDIGMERATWSGPPKNSKTKKHKRATAPTPPARPPPPTRRSREPQFAPDPTKPSGGLGGGSSYLTGRAGATDDEFASLRTGSARARRPSRSRTLPSGQVSKLLPSANVSTVVTGLSAFFFMLPTLLGHHPVRNRRHPAPTRPTPETYCPSRHHRITLAQPNTHKNQNVTTKRVNRPPASQALSLNREGKDIPGRLAVASPRQDPAKIS